MQAQQRRKSIIAATLGLVLALTACSGGGSNPSGGPSATGGTLTIIQNTPPISLDPAKSNNGLAGQWADIAYANLLHWAGDSTFKPELAASYSMNSDNTQIELKLKPNIKFADGSTLDSAAVKQSLTYFKDTANGPFAANAQALIKSIDTPDNLTVDVNFTTPTPDAASYFADGGTWGNIISPSALSNPDALGTTTAGAGPYMLDPNQSTSGSTYTYVKNPNWSGDASLQKWDSIVIKVIEDVNAALQAVQTTPNSWTNSSWQYSDTAQKAGLQVVTQTIGGTVYSIFLTDRAGKVQPALGIPEVRQALNYAVDRNSIASLVHGVANEQIAPAGLDGYFTDGNVYTFDAAKAKQMLADAGYPNGFSFDCVIQSFDPNISQAAQVVASNFKDVGVTMNIITANSFQDFVQKQGTKKYSADIEQWGGTTFHTIAQQLVLPSGVVNPWQNSDDEMLALFNKASAEPQDQAATDWEALSKMVTQKAWYVPMFTVQSIYIATKGLDALGDSSLAAPNPLYM